MKSETVYTTESRAFFSEIEKMSDRELQESIYLKYCQIEKSNKRIGQNMQYWFYLFITAIFLVLFSTVKYFI